MSIISTIESRFGTWRDGVASSYAAATSRIVPRLGYRVDRQKQAPERRESRRGSRTISRSPIFNMIQTFFVDPDQVQGSPTVSLTMIDLFFKAKPHITLNASGLLNPGVVVSICEVENGKPDLTKEFLETRRLTYDEVFAIDSADIATSFGFENPIIVTTGRYYGVVIRLEDSNYDLWVNKKGDKLVNTSTASPGSLLSRDGDFFSFSTGGQLTPVNSTDLKFRVKIAEHVVEVDHTLDYTNRGHDFIRINNRVGRFRGGEWVFVLKALRSGTITINVGSNVITGVGTTFTGMIEGQQFIVQSGTNYEVHTVQGIINNTSILVKDPASYANTSAVHHFGPVGLLHQEDYVNSNIVLTDPTSNTTYAFIGGDVVRGHKTEAEATIVSVDDIGVDELVSHFNVTAPSATTYYPEFDFARANGGGHEFIADYKPLPHNQIIRSNFTERRWFISRSNEVSEPLLHTDKRKSVHVRIRTRTSNPYVAPVVEPGESDLTIRRVLVSNTTSHLVGGLDTEITQNGTALCKHIAQKMTFEGTRQAEDLRVFVSAHRPVGTDVRLYAKIHNSADSESFDDKPWSPLAIIDNKQDVYSPSEGTQFTEYQYALPSAPETLEDLVGSFTTVNASAVITGNGTADLTTKVVAGQLIKVYSPLFPSNYIMSTVASVTSGTITLTDTITNVNVTGAGFKVATLKYNTAFVNSLGGGFVRYFNSTGTPFDKYNTVQIKVVLEADDPNVFPRVDQLEAIGVSA